MPRNENQPAAFDYSRNLRDGRADVQGPCQLFVDSLFSGCTVLDVGAGLGQSRARIRHNRVTTYDIDERLRPFVDVAGGPVPPGPFDLVTAFDVIEHVEDDLRFAQKLAARATRAVVVVTPNWRVSRCQSTHHVREYTGAELRDLALQLWPQDALRLFGHYKDGDGSWFDLIPDEAWDAHAGSKHVLAVLLREEDRQRIDRFFAGRWGTLIPPGERWTPWLSDGDDYPNPLVVAFEGQP